MEREQERAREVGIQRDIERRRWREKETLGENGKYRHMEEGRANVREGESYGERET